MLPRNNLGHNSTTSGILKVPRRHLGPTLGISSQPCFFLEHTFAASSTPQAYLCHLRHSSGTFETPQQPRNHLGHTFIHFIHIRGLPKQARYQLVYTKLPLNYLRHLSYISVTLDTPQSPPALRA
jgi:hypothetical protein